jgi:pimeloyl-ACP methyl ester carboxylesterase
VDQYAELGRLRMFYEVHSAGEPLVLLHGALGGPFVWRHQLPALVEHFRVFLPAQRGRDRTPDGPGPVSYQLLADDIVAFLEQVIAQPCHLVGASDGGVVGLLLALQRPELLRKLVLIGANYHRDGLVPGSGWTEGGPADAMWAGPRQHYAAVSPDGPEHWAVLFAKLQRMWRDEPSLSVSDLQAISLPVLVMVGDDDAVALDHTAALYQALPAGQLAVIPGASHAVFMEKPVLVNRLILDFLAEAEPPNTLLPIRRQGTVGT